MPRFEVTLMVRETRIVEDAKDEQDAVEQANAMATPTTRETSQPRAVNIDPPPLPEGVEIASEEEPNVPYARSMLSLKLTGEHENKRRVLLNDVYAFMEKEHTNYSCGKARRITRNHRVVIEPLDLGEKVDAFIAERAKELGLELNPQ